MASEFRQQVPVRCLKPGGAPVNTADLTEHFRPLRDTFQTVVGSVAFVKTENGIKCVCLTKKGQGDGACSGTGTGDTGVSRHPPRARQVPGSGYGNGGSPRTGPRGSEGSATPKASRRHFLQAMIDSSPQVRRSVAMRGSVYLSSKSDSDSASVASSNPDEDDDPAPVTLDPLEHEWMLCASDGEWASLSRLLAAEPALLLKKDFVTGFTCLHWAAKHGKPKLIALVVNFAKRHGVPISVDVRSNAGYTPLHVAAMHNHTEVVKLLVGAYDANVEIRDYSGKKACQYLSEQAGAQSADCQDGGRWRFSRVLQSNLKPLRLLNNDGGDEADGEGRQQEKPLRRKSSLSGMKPRLQRLRMRTSQIVHSVTFHDTEELEKCGRGSWRSRPKTHFFG
uniref:Sosondowah ankyrin repeat domain family member C n=1 Tax=Sphaeramia orbicularis TaxID=375764 RepID=A0A673A704_9TELE